MTMPFVSSLKTKFTALIQDMRTARYIDAINRALVEFHPGQQNDEACKQIADIFLGAPDSLRPHVVREACKQARFLQESKHMDFMSAAAIHALGVYALEKSDPAQSQEIMLYLCDYINPLVHSDMIRNSLALIPYDVRINIIPDLVHNIQDRIEKTNPSMLAGLYQRHNCILAELALDMIEKLPSKERLQETRDFHGWLLTQTIDNRFDVNDHVKLNTRATDYIVSYDPNRLNGPRLEFES